jgi:hypothetical protein
MYASHGWNMCDGDNVSDTRSFSQTVTDFRRGVCFKRRDVVRQPAGLITQSENFPLRICFRQCTLQQPSKRQ